MNTNLNSYIKIYKNRVDITLCKEILQQQSSPDAIWQEHTWTNERYEVIKNTNNTNPKKMRSKYYT